MTFSLDIDSVVVLETMVLVSSGLEAKFAGLGLAFKQDQDLINFYCAISATKLWLLYITETHCPRFDTMHAFSRLHIVMEHLRRLKGCSATVAYLWGRIVPDWENLWYPTLCSWSATGTWTTRMWMHGHWTLYQLSCRCSEWFDFIDSVLVIH